MATEWQTGDVITAEKLNDLESRAGGALMVTVVDKGDSRYELDKTWQEIHDAYVAARPVFVDYSAFETNGISSVCDVFTTNDGYCVAFFRIGSSSGSDWLAYTADGYPGCTYD